MSGDWADERARAWIGAEYLVELSGHIALHTEEVTASLAALLREVQGEARGWRPACEADTRAKTLAEVRRVVEGYAKEQFNTFKDEDFVVRDTCDAILLRLEAL